MFLSVESVLEQCKNCSAKAAMLFHEFSNKLKEPGLDITKVGGMVSDGASIMLEHNSGAAAKLKAIVVHIICHQLT